jgi:L-rhamnose-H+ transport protein
MGVGVGLGLGLVLLGGLLQGSFALPMSRMKSWKWENTWLVYSIVAMIVLPWLLAAVTVPSFGGVLHSATWKTLFEVGIFGFGWGVGSTLFGLGLKRVGMALSFAIILGITASFGSLLPLIVLHPENLMTRQGYALMAGLALVILGIVMCSVAGHRRERENPQAVETEKSGFWLGLLICVLSGFFSPMLNFSFVFGKDLQQLAADAGAQPAMASNSIWAVALTAGFLANAGYCVYLLQKNRTWDLFAHKGVPGVYWLGASLMGLIWFAGIAVYGIGAAGMGALGAVMGWPLFMAMIIIMANLWGAVTGEWKGASKGTYAYSWTGIVILVLAIYVISRGSAT